MNNPIEYEDIAARLIGRKIIAAELNNEYEPRRILLTLNDGAVEISAEWCSECLTIEVDEVSQ